MDTTPYAAPYQVRLSPSTRAAKEAAAMLGRPGVWPMMLTTFFLCALLTIAPFIVADCFYTFLVLAHMPETAQGFLYDALYVLAAVITALAVLPVWLGRLRLSCACFMGEDPHPRETFYYLTSPRRWGRALGILALLAVLLAIPVGLSACLFILCRSMYDAILPHMPLFAAAFLYMTAVLFAVALVFVILLLCAPLLPFAAVAVGNDDLRLYRALGLSLRAGKRNFGALAAFIAKSFLRLLLGLLTVGVLQVLWNTRLFLLSYTRLTMALCPKGEPQ